jgi:hypothetical protein
VLQQYRGEIALIDGLKAAEQGLNGSAYDPEEKPKKMAPVDLEDEIPF